MVKLAATRRAPQHTGFIDKALKVAIDRTRAKLANQTCRQSVPSVKSSSQHVANAPRANLQQAAHEERIAADSLVGDLRVISPLNKSSEGNAQSCRTMLCMLSITRKQKRTESATIFVRWETHMTACDLPYQRKLNGKRVVSADRVERSAEKRHVLIRKSRRRECTHFQRKGVTEVVNNR